jgi:16S rRNA (cytosine967-C5)-methyltransferase
MSIATGRLRAEAAKVIAAVLDGRSLKAVLGPAEHRVDDPRDRALLHAIVLAAIRGAVRWRALLRILLSSPLPARARPVEAALMAAFAQIDSLGLPAHAVVDETVAAVRVLRQPGYASLANAVLRRWLREREALAAALADDEEALHGHPSWLLEQLRADWPDDWREIVDAGNTPAPMWLRVNTQRTSVDDYRDLVATAGLHATSAPTLPQALRLDEAVPVARLPKFRDGWVSVQDGAAQHAAELLAPEAGQRVLDACAAPGGKTAHLLERTAGIDLTGVDIEPGRLAHVAENLDRLGLRARLVPGDVGRPADWWDGRPFDRILLDAPCSATGILRRQPDVRLHRRASDIPVLADRQRRLLASLWPLLAPGGRFVFAVCSVLRAESADVLATFLADHDDAVALPIDIAAAHPFDAGVQLLPGRDGMDGFAYALLVKR